MSYAANIQNDSEVVSQFVRVTCRLRVLHSAFSVHAGSVYVADFTHGPIHTFEFDGTAYTLGASATLSAGEFYYDRDQSKLYIRMADSGAPASTDFFVAHFYLFYSEIEVLWHETPDDASTAVVQWAPLLKKAPAYKITAPQFGFGFFPQDPSELTLINDHTLNYLMFHGSFRRTSCEVWSRYGSMEVANIEPKVTGLLGERISPSESGIRFEVMDKGTNFDAPVTGNIYSSNGVDPRYKFTPMLKLYGKPRFTAAAMDEMPVFEMVNIGYNSDAPTTSNNRLFGIVHDPSGEYAEISVPGELSGSSNRFFFDDTDDAVYFREGAQVWYDSGTDRYLVVETNFGNSLSFDPAAPAGETSGSLKTSFIQAVYLVKNGVDFVLLTYGRDWRETLHSGNIRGITLQTAAEANNSVATFDPATDSIWCAPIGKVVSAQHDGVDLEVPDFGSTTYWGAPAIGVYILYRVLKEVCGLSEDDIDFDSIESALDTVDWNVMLPIPFGQGLEQPKQRDVLDTLLLSLTLRGFFNKDGKFSVRPYRVISTTEQDVEKQDILSFETEIDYSDVYGDVRFPYAWEANAQRRIETSQTKAAALAGLEPEVRLVEATLPREATDSMASNEALYLHKSDKQIVIPHIATGDGDPSGTNVGLNRLRDYFGERAGRFTLKTKRVGLERSPSDAVKVYRDSMLGQNDAPGNNYSFEILDIEKSEEITMILGDNKAASDKSGESYW